MFGAIIASLCVASISLIGTLLFQKSGHITGTHRFIIPTAMGVFLGVVFFELIPETLEGNEWFGSLSIVVGFLSFYLLSHILRSYHHHHDEECSHSGHEHSARLLLTSDAIHNIADGVVITSAFLINPAVGIATTIGIALHEIPQEIAEYSVLLHAGYSRAKAALYNFLTALSIFLGVIISIAFLQFGDYIWILTGIAAGNLLYIAASDMIPELSGHKHREHFMQTFISTLLGLAFIVGLLTWTHGSMEHHEDEEHLEDAKILAS